MCSPRMDTPLQRMERRLESLEQQTAAAQRSAHRARRTSRLMGLFLGVWCCVAAVPNGQVEDVLQTRDLQILDEAGRMVIRAQGSASGGQFDIWTADGRNVMRLTANEFGGDLALWNREGVNVFGAFTTGDGGETALWNQEGVRVLRARGAGEGGRLDLHNRRDQAIWTASVTDQGGHLSIAEPGGQAVVSASSTAMGGALSVNNAHGAPVVTITAGDLGTGQLSINDSAGQERATVRVSPEGGESRFVSASGVAVATLGASPNRPGGALKLFNEQGAAVIDASGDKDQCGRFDIANDRGIAVFSVDGLKDIGVTLSLNNAAGRQNLLLATRTGGGVVNLLNSYGSPTFSAGTGQNGRSGTVSVMNERGMRVVVLETGADEAGVVKVWDADGRAEQGALPIRSVLDR